MKSKSNNMEQYGWIDIVDGGQLPELGKAVPTIRGSEMFGGIMFLDYSGQWVLESERLDEFQIELDAPIAWFNVPPYQPKPVQNYSSKPVHNYHDQHDGC